MKKYRAHTRFDRNTKQSIHTVQRFIVERSGKFLVGLWVNIWHGRQADRDMADLVALRMNQARGKS